jgi:hypothetical protein
LALGRSPVLVGFFYMLASSSLRTNSPPDIFYEYLCVPQFAKGIDPYRACD